MFTARLSTKFTVVISGLILMASLALSLFFIRSASREILMQQKDRADTLARGLAYNSEYGVLIKNDPILRGLVNGVISEKDVVYVEIKDMQGRPMLSVGEKKRPCHAALASIVTRRKARGPGSDTQNTEELFFIESPDIQVQENIGVVAVCVSLEGTHEKIREMRNRAIGIASIVAAASVLMIVVLVRKITLPLKNLVLATEKLAQGDLSARAAVTTRDEIGELAGSFNHMSQELEKSRDQLRDYNRTLEDKVAARTNDLKQAQEKIVRSEKLAAIGQLASSVGHELRNPLAAIGNALYYLKGALQDAPVAKEDPSILEFMALAEQESKNTLAIINELLDFARIARLAPQETDVNQLLRSVKSVLEVPANVRLKEDCDPDLPPAVIDPQKIRQVFINLANNAIQAMPGGGELTLSTHKPTGPSPDSKEYILVEFKDTGAGIAKENVDRIFEPLFTTKAKGTGLGLPICLGIVEKHGGGIAVASEPGKGTIFTVKIPIKFQAERSDRPV